MFVLSIDAHKTFIASMKTIDEKQASAAYAFLLNRAPLMSFRDVLRLICILGDTNSNIAQQLMENLLTKRPASHAELLTYVHDIERVWLFLLCKLRVILDV